MKEENLFLTYLDSPIGIVEVAATAEAIKKIEFVDDKMDRTVPPVAVLQEAADQLTAYFDGKLQQFDLPLAPEGTAFRQKVWQALLQIPFGQTTSYLDIARAIGNPKAVRAVGGANHHNPISIVIPCHRVIGANGKLTGYGGGLWRKEWLLQHERTTRYEPSPGS